MTTELTKRKAAVAVLDVAASPPSSSHHSQPPHRSPAEPSGQDSTSASASASVRALEFDVRPSCSHDPARRYLRAGSGSDALAPTTHRSDSAASSSSRSAVARCLSLSGLSRELQEMFLPAGYPASVSEDYLTFQCWDTIQAMCSYLRGVLATQSVLQSVGVGDENATPLAAALQWVLRDGSGMLGGLAFAYGVGPHFDSNVKRWRLFADVINDVGLTLDMLAPYCPAVFVTELLCVSSICKTMCGVAAGATRSSLMTHFAKRDNMADCAAKEGSQETAVKLAGLVVGMYFASAVNASRASVWVAFGLLTVLHVYANYNAVAGLSIPTLNRQRADILMRRYLQQHDKDADAGWLSIRSVNQAEPIFRNPELPILDVVMGAQLCQVASTHQELDQLLQLYREERYLLSVQRGRVMVVFHDGMTPRDELRAFFQAVLVLQHGISSSAPDALPLTLLQSTHQRMTAEFEFFYQRVQANGWKTHMFLLKTTSWRVKLL
ncbi:hypothetical protein ATCC90586_007903 [Pythium insidiosum]|nr:hypothetical protein ATCC90586_007903 [Pythium insidiosum]